MKPAVFYVLPAILIVALIACSNPDDDPIIDEDLLGVVWKVDSLQTPEEKIVTHPLMNSYIPDHLTVQFTEEMKISGYDPCWFSYEAVYETYKDGSIELGSVTVMGDSCGSYLEHVRDTFISALGAVTLYIVEEYRLDLYDRDRNYVIFLSVGSVDEGFRNVRWIADSLKTPEEKVICRDTTMAIKFADMLRYSGWTCSNGCYGHYTNQEKGALEITSLGTTLGGCHGRYCFLERYFIAVLKNTTEYSLEGDSFIIYDREHRYVLYFSAE